MLKAGSLKSRPAKKLRNSVVVLGFKICFKTRLLADRWERRAKQAGDAMAF